MSLKRILEKINKEDSEKKVIFIDRVSPEEIKKNTLKQCFKLVKEKNLILHLLIEGVGSEKIAIIPDKVAINHGLICFIRDLNICVLAAEKDKELAVSACLSGMREPVANIEEVIEKIRFENHEAKEFFKQRYYAELELLKGNVTIQ